MAGHPRRVDDEGHQRPHRGFNRIIKNTKRVACGFRNLENYQRRILSTIALTEHDETQHDHRPAPRKVETVNGLSGPWG